MRRASASFSWSRPRPFSVVIETSNSRARATFTLCGRWGGYGRGACRSPNRSRYLRSFGELDPALNNEGCTSDNDVGVQRAQLEGNGYYVEGTDGTGWLHKLILDNRGARLGGNEKSRGRRRVISTGYVGIITDEWDIIGFKFAGPDAKYGSMIYDCGKLASGSSKE